MGWGINLVYKTKSLSLNKKLVITFTIIMILTIISISAFVNMSFEAEFSKYVDESNKTEVEHLVFDLRNMYKDNGLDIETIKQLGEDAISKGIALEVYDKNDKLIWSIFKDEKMLSNQTLNNIKKNMKSINQNWDGKLQEYKFDLYDDENSFIGYEKIVHYDSIYYMENDIEFLNIMNKFMIITSVISIGSVIIISMILSKSIANPIVKVSKMAKVIEEGKYKDKLEYKSNINEVNELIVSINKLAEALNEQDILRKRLTTDIAHELRTPLTSVQGHLDAIIDGIWEPTPERLASINEEVSRIGNLVGHLRNLARYDSEKNKIEKSEVNLRELIQNIVYNYESKALEKNININCDLKEIWVYIDKDQFYQVIINLLSNAIKYTNEYGNIYIKIYEENDKVKIHIKDNGIGIPQEDINYIFERFYRVDKSRHKDTGGIGVGLTITKSIVNAHKGSIEVNSTFSKGTEFIIKIPKF